MWREWWKKVVRAARAEWGSYEGGRAALKARSPGNIPPIVEEDRVTNVAKIRAALRRLGGQCCQQRGKEDLFLNAAALPLAPPGNPRFFCRRTRLSAADDNPGVKRSAFPARRVAAAKSHGANESHDEDCSRAAGRCRTSLAASSASSRAPDGVHKPRSAGREPHRLRGNGLARTNAHYASTSSLLPFYYPTWWARPD